MNNDSTALHVSLFCAALLLPLTIFVSSLVGYVLKMWNPSGVNINSDLAYLAPILLSGIACYALLLVIGLISGLRALGSSARPLAKLSLELLACETVLIVLILVLRQATKSL